jgi:hypothetical protein
MKYCSRPFDLFQDSKSLGGPDEGFRVLIVRSDVGFDGVNQLGSAMEEAPANALTNFLLFTWHGMARRREASRVSMRGLPPAGWGSNRRPEAVSC